MGLDTAPDYVPEYERRRSSSDAEAVFAFNQAIIDATADCCACFKVQIAYYEALGKAGIETYAKTLRSIREKGCLTIADVKRGDIADTAVQYAKAHFEGDFEADFVTLSPYMGMDSIDPWFAYAKAKNKGAFVLLRTSNKGMNDFQNLELGTPQYPGQRLYHAVGDRLAALADACLGIHGYGAFGAVVGANPKTEAEREEAAAIRRHYSSLFFLIPGYGAQGGAAEDAALLLQKGNGGVVNASRSILKAWTAGTDSGNTTPEGREPDNEYAAETARKVVLGMRSAIQAAIKQ